MIVEHVTSSELLDLAKQHQDSQGTMLLYSGGSQDSATKSFLCWSPSEILTIYPGKWVLTSQFAVKEGSHTNPWTSLNDQLRLSKDDRFKDVPEWAGYIAYEMGAFTDEDQTLPHILPSIPLAQFYKYNNVLIAPADRGKLPVKDTSSSTNRLIPDHYLNLIHQIQKEIRHGDVYQVNLSHEMQWPFRGNPYGLFLQLIQLNPSPFAAFLTGDEFSIISSSPERLLKKQGQILETRPIKGTAPRGKTEAEDQLLAQQLMHSIKDRAELLMITDLMRNDLGKVSLPGSVLVDSLFKMEAYPNLFHLISIIRSYARPELSPVDLLRSCFPGGSVTGCPKQSAMQSIWRHEKRARGIYTGSIGYFTSTGDFDFNIAIRTLLLQNEMLYCSLGGAIVADSIPEDEYNETFAKGASIFSAIKKNNDITGK